MKKSVVASAFIALVLAAQCLYSAETPKAETSAKPKKEFTKAEYADHIGHTLQGMAEILNFIPGLKEEKNPEGKELYTYNGTTLGDLDKEKLKALFSKVQNEAVRIRTERLNKQLESIRQAEVAARQAQQASRAQVVQPPPSPPRIYQPPQTPKVQPPPQTPPRR